MTMTEWLDVMIPVMTLIVLIGLTWLIVSCITVVIQVKKLLTRFETISDVTSWIQLVRKWPKRKKSNE